MTSEHVVELLQGRFSICSHYTLIREGKLLQLDLFD